jgi:UDPglucose 6-dehydrogenase
MMTAIVESNRTRKDFIAEQVLRKLEQSGVEVSSAVVGIYRLTMKTDSDNFRHSAIQGIMRRLHERGVRVVIYEPTLQNGERFYDCEVVDDIVQFKHIAQVIIANRRDNVLSDVSSKVYTRDIFGRD